jgi:hypothetical protein
MEWQGETGKQVEARSVTSSTGTAVDLPQGPNFRSTLELCETACEYAGKINPVGLSTLSACGADGD